jgi:FKBP-type peptidyl-prolyl cis-trans isomerase
MRWHLLAVAVVALGGTLLVADDKKADKPKMPDLEAKGWKKRDDGIKVWDVTEGSGEAVKEGDTITMHYTLWLTDGTFIQSSKTDGGKPFTASLKKGLIKGWQLAVPGMKPGGVRRLLIPPELGYGKEDKGDIPPNSTLMFEIEMPAEK